MDKVKKAKDDQAVIGHNSGSKNPEVIKLFDQTADLDKQIKKLNKEKRDIRNKAKVEFSISTAVFNHEVRMRKLDSDVRLQFESGLADLHNMMGYQISLQLVDKEPGKDGKQETKIIRKVV